MGAATDALSLMEMVDANSFNSSNSVSSSSGNNPYQVNIKIMIAAIVVLFSVILFILSLHLYAKWFWKNSQFAASRRRRLQLQQIQEEDPLFFNNNPALGLDKALIQALPVFVFQEQEGKTDCCSVCLSEFEQGEQGKSLPKCGHSFHTECIDMWLHCHSTCPLCRRSLLWNPAGEEEIEEAFQLKSANLMLLACPPVTLQELVSLDLQNYSDTGSNPTLSAAPSSSSSSTSSSSSSILDSVRQQHQVLLNLEGHHQIQQQIQQVQHQIQQAAQQQQIQAHAQEQAAASANEISENSSSNNAGSTNNSKASNLVAKSRWRYLRRMLGRISPASSTSSPSSAISSAPSSSWSFSSSSISIDASDLQSYNSTIAVLVME